NGGYGLTVSTSGTTRVGNAVGGATTLASLASVGTGAVTLDGNVTTSGAQSYTGAVTLGNSVALTSDNAGVGFTGAVDNATSGTPEVLTVNAANGLVSFGGTVGGGANGALSGLTTSSKTFSANTLNIGSGGLSVKTTGGGIAQGGAFIVTGSGTSIFDAGGNAVTLNNSNNDFAGAVTATGAGVSIFGKNTLNIASLTDNGNGNVNLTAGGTLALPNGGIDAGSGNIALASNGGALAAGNVSGNNVSLTGSGGTLGGDVLALGTLALASTNAAIVQMAGGLIIDGGTTVNAGNGGISLAGANNAFVGAVGLAGGITQIAATTQPLILGQLNTGALTATSNGGALNLGQGTIAGGLTATAAGNITEAGALGVSGPSSLTVIGGQHDILLSEANDFGGQTVTVNASGGGSIGTLSLGDSNAAAL